MKVTVDKFLKEGESYNRLLLEYKKYGKLIIAVDFDDTLHDYHREGNSYELVTALVKELYANDFYIIIWTANPDLDYVSTYLHQHDIPYHKINEVAPVSEKWLNGSNPRKIYANAFLDDRAGLIQVYNDLIKLLNYINPK